jgi:hypothetical protein
MAAPESVRSMVRTIRRPVRRASTAVSGSSSRRVTSDGRGPPALGTQPAGHAGVSRPQPSTAAAPRWVSATSASRSAASSAGPPTTATVPPVARRRATAVPRSAAATSAATSSTPRAAASPRAAPASSPVSSTGTRPSRRRPRTASAAPGRTGSTTSRTARATPSHDTATAVAPAAWIVVTASASLAGRSIPCPVSRETRPTSAAWAITRGSPSGSARNSETIPRTPSPG